MDRFAFFNHRAMQSSKNLSHVKIKTSQPVTLFVQKLSLLTQPHHLVQFFGDACRVVDYHFIYDGKTGRFLRQCYVQFETREIGVEVGLINHLVWRSATLPFRYTSRIYL
ncbi:hypothetical protein ACSBR1_040079 [Camellia fascicularis]